MTEPPTTSVVLADEHPFFRAGVRQALLGFGTVQVVGEAVDGESAVRTTIEKRPDLILSEFNLRDFSGTEVLRLLREAGVGTKVLFLTAGMSRQQTLEALELGARGVLTKDADAQLLGKAVRCVMAGEYWIGRDLIADWLDHRSSRKPKDKLTAREREIVNQVVTGNTNREIAAALSISDETVKHHIRNVFDKLGVSSRVELTLYITAGNLSL